ncbi:MAG: hypothetical protein ACUVS3_05085 [Thermodesulfobacteriota bacterium]
MSSFGRFALAVAILVGFGVALMGCATTEDLKAVEQKAQMVSDKVDKAMSEAQAAKAAAANADASAKKAADSAAKAEAAASRAESAARAAADSAAKCDAMVKKAEAAFMKKMKK